MRLIVGLGNPDRQYQKTRHNVGFMVVERLAARHAPSERVRSQFHADTVEAAIGGARCLLVRPVTYMNRSGLSVQEAVRFYRAEPANDLLVITDDIYLPVGAVRLRARGSAGGHNGLQDIIRALGGDEYPRCRVGVGAKLPFMDQADYVLSRFSDVEAPAIEAALERAADAAEVFATRGIDAAMNQFNERVARGDASPEPEPPKDVHPGWLGAEADGAQGNRGKGPASKET
ncbi:MAG: aminoacyl-tRNA hydrolase [Phycisphaeraceae bacterium]|nr:aminoacyl-tRNA hydrolase [Phycisphaeraceae bacterium]